MLERIANLPENVVGIRASGEVTGDDYRTVLIPAVEEALKTNDKVRMLYEFGNAVTGMSMDAAWEDSKVGIGHFTKWEKVAVISDKEWLRHSVNVFGHLMPGEVRAFLPDQEEEARKWITQ